jgi:hypothetical protein
VPGATEEDVVNLLNGGDAITSSSESLSTSAFANLFDGHPIAPLEEGYTEIRPASHGQPCAYRLNLDGDRPLPKDNLDEHWRQVYVDVSVPNVAVNDPEYVSKLASWLVRNQPISLAINGDSNMAMQLFEQTGQVVYSVGDIHGATALTCQARPQDGEVFGEFPPRKELGKYTKFPMVIPSPPAGYNAQYSSAHLLSMAENDHIPAMFQDVKDTERRGYLAVLANYLEDAASGPKEGWRNGMEDARTCLYGLQRPPLSGQPTVVRCDAHTSLDDAAPILLPFVCTNAKDQLEVSVHPKNQSVIKALEGSGVSTVIEEDFDIRYEKEIDEWYNVVRVETMGDEYPLAAQWISLYFPLGHIKSTKSNDREFIELFQNSQKWLRYDSN